MFKLLTGVAAGCLPFAGLPLAMLPGFAAAQAATVPASLAAPSLPSVVTLFGATQPALTSANDGVPYELGTVFRPSADGLIDRVRFYKSPQETGSHTAHLWAYASQTLLATVPFTKETASGWQEMALAKPVPVSAGSTYVVSVNTNGFYADTVGGLATPVVNTYLATANDVPNGVYGTPGAFPATSFESSNYFADVEFHVTQTVLTAQTPDLPNATDGTPYDLGMRFVPATNGRILALRAYQSPGEVGVAHQGTLWTDAGAKLAGVKFPAPAASGWQQVALAQPVRVTAGQTYVVSVTSAGYYPDTLAGLAAPGIAGSWIGSYADPNGNNGVFGAPGVFPTRSFDSSNYFRDVVFEPDAYVPPPPKPVPFTHRGYLGWIRDLATEPAPAAANWPYLAIDEGLLKDYAFTENYLKTYNATEIEIWGLAAAGDSGVPGYLPDVEATASPTRVAQVKKIIADLHAKGLKVLAGMGGMSWGFDQIIAVNPAIACPGNPLVANPLVQTSWDYQYRIIDYLFSFGVDGITVQSGDEGRCDIPALSGLDNVDYHARIVDPIAVYIRGKYPNAIIGSANYGIDLSNPADLPYVQAMTAHLDYLNDVYGDIASPYRAQLIAAIQPAQFGTEATPAAAGSDVHFNTLSWFVPTFQHDLANLASLYQDGGRANENYMRIANNPGEEVSGALVLMYEANPASNWNANLATVLRRIFAPNPSSSTALARLQDVFVSAENAYFSNANSQNLLIEAYYDYSDRGFPYLRDNMSAAGRAAFRASLVTLLAEAQGLQGDVGNTARLQDVITAITNTIAAIDALG